MLDETDLEMNVLEFRQRTFQFERLLELGGREYAVFSRTETESESQFRPRLVHLRVVVPRGWVVYDEANDLLLVARDGSTLPAHPAEEVTEIRAESPEFAEQGIDWRRVAGPGGVLVYAPEDLQEELLTSVALAQILGP